MFVWVGVSHRHFESVLPEIRLILGPVIRFRLEVKITTEALVGSAGWLSDGKLVLGVCRSQDQTHRALESLHSANRVLFLHKLAFKNLMQEVTLEDILVNLL